MNGFIFGFQRFVWCPKWTPASNNSGTNSVVSAISEIPERELPERDIEHATTHAGAQPKIRLVSAQPIAMNSGLIVHCPAAQLRNTSWSAVLTAGARLFLCVSRQNPAEIRKTV